MSKRLRNQAYRSSVLSDLTRQLLYSPPEKRAEVVGHAEQLHDELEPAKNYPIDFVIYRLTQRRVPPSENVMFVGEAIKPDLRLLIDTISRSVEMRCDEADPGMTTKELAESLAVSTKTIARWRNSGLRWRWGVRAGKQTVLIPQSALAAYEYSDGQRVCRAAAFTRLTEHEKERLLNRARRLAQASQVAPQAILEHLSKRSRRSVESLRQLIRKHDAENPYSRVFMDRTGPLSHRQKKVIDRAYRRGLTVSALCERFEKTRSTIYRVIHQARADRIRTVRITWVYSPVFERRDADEVLMMPPTPRGKARRLGAEAISVLPDTLRAIYDRPIETGDAVRSRIVRYNFMKYRAAQQQQQILEAPPRAGQMDQFDDLLGRIGQARGEIISAVLPIVLSVVLRQQMASSRASESSLMEMLFLGHGVMLEEIDQFDASVAHSVETVLTNRLLRVLSKPRRAAPAANESMLVEQLADAGFTPRRSAV